MDIEQIRHYIKTVIKYWVEDLPPAKSGLLLLDNFKGHINADIEESFRQLRVDVLIGMSFKLI